MEELYYLTEREKKISKILNNKYTLKQYHFQQTVCLRLLIAAAFFIEKFVSQYWLIVEEILSYVSFSELAQLAIVMRDIGCPNFFAYLKLQSTSNRSGRKILTSIFFNKSSANDHLLILNFQKRQYDPLHRNSICEKKSECHAFLRKILISEKNLLTLSRCLEPTNADEFFDSLDMGALHSEYNENFITFNPCFELGAFITSAYMWIFSYGGKSRENIGQIVYRFNKTKMATHLKAEWSPDGLHLILLSINKYSPKGEIIIFRYLSVAGIARKVKVTPNISFDSFHCSSKLWCGPSALMFLSPAGKLIKAELSNVSLNLQTLFAQFTSSIVGPEKYTRRGEDFKTSFGCLTCCPNKSDLLAILKPCGYSSAHQHEVVVLLQVDALQIVPLIYISAPGFILEFNFYKTSNELWMLWKENLNELWPKVQFNHCRITIPGNCPFVDEQSILKDYLTASTAANYDGNASSQLGVGHYSLSENYFYPLQSLEANYLPRKIKFTWEEFEAYANVSTKEYSKRSEKSAFGQKMQITDHFVGLSLHNKDNVLVTYRVIILIFLYAFILFG
jgi:hypothetical protein